MEGSWNTACNGISYVCNQYSLDNGQLHSLDAVSFGFHVPHSLDSREGLGTIVGSSACSDYQENLKR